MVTSEQPAKETSPRGRAKFSKAFSKFPLWLRATVLTLMIVGGGISYFRSFSHIPSSTVDSDDSDQDVSSIEARKAAPNITVYTDKGQETKLSALKGKVVLVSFWASWCGPCLEELPTFSPLLAKYHDRGLEILAVNVDESEDDAKTFIADFWKNKAISFPTYFDRNSVASRAFNVEVLPANFVLDRKGRIALTGYGASDWGSEEIDQSLEDLLKE